MKRLINFLAIATLLTVGSSCSKDDTPTPVPDPNVTFKATINGASEVPVNASTATGTATVIFNQDTKILTLNMTYTGVTATNMHIHRGAAGVSGPVVYGLGSSPFTSPISYTSPAITVGQQDSLMNNMLYVNIHSAAFGGGEIRGQLIKQ
ncbi:CHRD domain-containing protein [Ferruginibacter sp.]